MAKVCISFDCPMVNQLIKNKNRKYDCSKCKKIVHDFSHLTDKEFQKQIAVIRNQDLCENTV